jgi:hypothetical protein
VALSSQKPVVAITKLPGSLKNSNNENRSLPPRGLSGLFCDFAACLIHIMANPMTDPAVGDRITLLDDAPDSIYEIVKISGSHATCRCLAYTPGPDRTGNNRRVPFWKICPVCAAAQAAAPVTPEECSHPRLLPGLDAAYCPDCRTSFGPNSKEYKLLQNAPNSKCVVVKGVLELEQTSSEDHSDRRSGVNRSGVNSEHAHWVETYSPSTRKGNAYYRYVWMVAQKMHHRHIPGGNVNSGVAQGRALEIKLAIAQGKSPQEIVQMLKGK